jgi:hypothetical protein
LPDGTSGKFFVKGLDRISDNRHVGQISWDKCGVRQKNFSAWVRLRGHACAFGPPIVMGCCNGHRFTIYGTEPNAIS